MPEPAEQIEHSILHDIKQMLGQEWDDSTYDLDIRNHINSIFFTLDQLGVGPEGGFEITDETMLWSAYVGPKKNHLSVKSYIYIRVRLLFDPPTNGFLVTSLQDQAKELEWRLMVENDRRPEDVPQGGIQ